ncbi:ectoine/hydroxyectoine ABC transporter permease subunit EhuD [Actinocorallia populi]|uniref:ectoine/hydroxyectoine ABC transporter permease subunit EhuD n=1 Tax=Actinocorallia populi TaxID=2079200 RepID=UPI000D0868D1|nr:ectoine/hydroxyectoine ABC transporter permease subunit EhuD [Actinocorallia populi]
MDAWKWDLFFGSFPYVARGLLVTLKITLFGSLLAYALGLLFAVLLRARIPVAHQLLRGFIEAIRSTPVLVQVFVLFWLMPQATGIKLDAETTGVLALGVHYACYTADVYRAGIDAVPAGQWEAATALSLPRSRVWLGVVLPQAVPRVVPALGNYTISMFKEVPLLLAIGVLDVLNRAKEFGADNYRVIEAYTMAGLVFLALSYPASILVRRLERRVAHP